MTLKMVNGGKFCGAVVVGLHCTNCYYVPVLVDSCWVNFWISKSVLTIVHEVWPRKSTECPAKTSI